MINFKAITLTALTALTFGAAAPKAEAYGGCYYPTAAPKMEAAIRGGATLQQAWQWAVQDGDLVDTERCFIQTKGYVLGLPYAFPALNGR